MKGRVLSVRAVASPFWASMRTSRAVSEKMIWPKEEVVV